MNKLLLSPEYMNEYTVPYNTKLDLADQPSLVYPGSSFYVSPITGASSPCPSSVNAFYDHQMTPFAIQPGSPDSFMSGMSLSMTPPPALSSSVSSSDFASYAQEAPMMVQSSSSSTMASSSSAYLNETIAKASSLPESFFPEFLQYSKESYEQSTGGSLRKKRRQQDRLLDDEDKCDELDAPPPKQHIQMTSEDDSGDEMTLHGVSTAEMRRQIHIQSEQKRRAQIKDGFEDLRNELPSCLNKKMSKVALLHRTVQHIQHLKSTQMTILAELERLVHENEQLRTFQQGVLQKQAMESIYSVNSL
ncbi:hypothetical protein CLU79DRAFT_783770 [Phycomyces nitens]|nr:hypothetical protein CLU79DRAFT_783770 [Phycomyces nitens]